MKKIPKNAWYLIISIAVLISLVAFMGNSSGLVKPPVDVPFSSVLDEVKQDKVASIAVSYTHLTLPTIYSV